tara:strand:- start:1134 stop:1328 length:195 start_codon:yes stop_codon:yes gene_type:complete
MNISPQQKILVEHLANGLKVGEIPKAMTLSQVSINKHMQALKKNLGAKTAAHAVARALREGLIE